MHAAQTPDRPGPAQPEPLHGSAAPANAVRILGEDEVADMVAEQTEAPDEEIDPVLDDDGPPAADSVRASGEAP